MSRPVRWMLVVSLGVLLFGLLLMVSGAQQTLSAGGWSAETEQPGIYLPVVMSAKNEEFGPYPTPTPPPDKRGWLTHLNEYRLMAFLPRVAENLDWGQGGWYHSRYMVKNDQVGHSEDLDNNWYTPEGDQAARTSNLLASSTTTITDNQSIDLWMAAPFHALSVIDPELSRVGFGSFRETDGGLQMGASLDVLRGLEAIPTSVHFPIAWPGDGRSVPLFTNVGEYPDPLSSCPGYNNPAGLPIILQIGAGDQTPNITAHTFSQDGAPLEHCVFHERNYTNPDGNAQALARAILDARDAIILIPRSPLIAGKTYSVSMTVNGQIYNWSFNVSVGQPLSEAPTGEIWLP